MSRVLSTEGDTARFGDRTQISPPPLKKPKTDPKSEAEIEIPQPERKLFPRMSNFKDPAYTKQRDMFIEQFEKSEGYDVEWDKFDYCFHAFKFEWEEDRFDEQISNKELMERLIKKAIDEQENEGTKLEFLKYVSANVQGVQGFLFYITFWAQDVSSPTNPLPKLYQTKVRIFQDEIVVHDFRLRPTQD